MALGNGGVPLNHVLNEKKQTAVLKTVNDGAAGFFMFHVG